jgi:hypothetical protein
LYETTVNKVQKKLIINNQLSVVAEPEKISREGWAQRWNRYRRPAGSVRSRSEFCTGRSTGRPATDRLIFFFVFFYMKIFKFLADLHRFLHRMPKGQLVEAEYISCDYIEKKFGTGINYKPAGYRSTGRLPVDRLTTVRPFDRSITVRPAGPVRSELFRPVPVPVMKNPDRFHLWLSSL